MTDKDKAIEVTTTAQIERTFKVKASSNEQAHQRLRSYLKDPDMFAEGLVVEDEAKRRDTSPQRVTSVGGEKVATTRSARTEGAGTGGGEGDAGGGDAGEGQAAGDGARNKAA